MNRMIITELSVRDLGPIRNLYINFNTLPRQNAIIIGENGVGKTWLLNLLATLTGNDAATELMVDAPVGYVFLSIKIGDKFLKFEAHGKLLRQDIESFKKKLGEHRSNYGITERNEIIFRHGCCDYVTFQRMFRDFCLYGSISSNFFSPFERDGFYSISVGDGSRRAILLMLLASMGNGPLLLDEPSSHLHIVSMRRMARILHHSNRQVILVTHAPEFIYREECVFSVERT